MAGQPASQVASPTPRADAELWQLRWRMSPTSPGDTTTNDAHRLVQRSNINA